MNILNYIFETVNKFSIYIIEKASSVHQNTPRAIVHVCFFYSIIIIKSFKSEKLFVLLNLSSYTQR